MKTVIIILVILGLLVAGFYLLYLYLSRSNNPRLLYFAIRMYEKRDRKKMPEPGGIVFTGSSIIYFWNTLEKDMDPLKVVNRAVAGARIGQLAYHAGRLIGPCKPAAIVLYAGSNDIQGSKPRSPGQVLEGFQQFIRNVRNDMPDVPVYYISIIPSPSRIRWKHWPAIQEANEKIRSQTGSDDLLKFIDITGGFLMDNGLSDPGLFKSDRIHLNEKGYNLLTVTIKSTLEKDMK